MVTAGVVLQVALLIQSDKLKNDYTYLSWLARVCKSLLVVCLVFLLILVESSFFCAMSTFSPVGSWYESVCVCGRNELEVCSTLAYPHISSFCAMPVLYTSTCAHASLEDSEPTGLKVDIAKLLPIDINDSLRYGVLRHLC